MKVEVPPPLVGNHLPMLHFLTQKASAAHSAIDNITSSR